MEIPTAIDKSKLPQHIAIIMDGNGRWAKMRGKPRTFGHRNAITAVRETVEAAARLGIKYLTLYAFSTENWSRPEKEVSELMELMVSAINKELPTLQKNNIRLLTIGNMRLLPEKCFKKLEEAKKATAGNIRMNLVVALSYSSRWEITEAVKVIAGKIMNNLLTAESVDEKLVSEHLTTTGIPDPELLIRTSGEHRISNFLLWQIAYSELFFTSKLWPDFRKEDLFDAVIDYQSRERRFGKTGDQVSEF